MIAAALLIIPGSAASGTGEAEGVAVGQVAVSGYASVGPRDPERATPVCIGRLRRTIVNRRAATWRWQSQLGLFHTPTARRARETRSCAYLGWIKGYWSRQADTHYRTWVKLSDPEVAICQAFQEYCHQALSVSWCESHHSTRAVNGQYRGLFQMGSSERRLFGHGETAYEQALAAHRYFVASGKDWSPWECKPY